MRLTLVFVAARGIGDFVAVPERVVLRRKQVGFHLTQNRSLFPSSNGCCPLVVCSHVPTYSSRWYSIHARPLRRDLTVVIPATLMTFLATCAWPVSGDEKLTSARLTRVLLSFCV